MDEGTRRTDSRPGFSETEFRLDDGLEGRRLERPRGENFIART